MQHLVADAVDHGECDVGAIFGRVDMNTERPLAERRIDDADDGIRDQGSIGIRWHDRAERFMISSPKPA